jgi:hypothetical protein
MNRQKLAICGGPKAIQNVSEDIFKWPIITEHRQIENNEVIL